MTFSLTMPSRTKLAFVLVKALLIVAVCLAGFLFAKGVGYRHLVLKPVYCPAKQMTKCVNEVVEGGGGSVVKNSCVKAKKTFLCDLELAGAYGPQCFDATVKRADEGFPLIASAAEKQCAA